MPSGIIYVLRCYEDDAGVLRIDDPTRGGSLHTQFFSHDSSVVAPFTQIYKDDFRNTPNDGWYVHFCFPDGTEPAPSSMTLQDWLDDAETAINAEFGSAGVGPSTPPSGYY